MLSRMKMANLAVIIFSVTAPLVHVRDLYDQFSVNTEFWFASQQLLHRGWNLLFGSVEILLLLTTLVLVYLRRSNRGAFQVSLLAAVLYAAMMGVFFVFDAPVNVVFSNDFSDVRSADWYVVRWSWETGHTIALGLAILGWLALLRASLLDHDPV